MSFTGSQEVGPSVAAAAVKTGARVQLEMGGKNPLIVLDDADLADGGVGRGERRVLPGGAALHGVEPASIVTEASTTDSWPR